MPSFKKILYKYCIFKSLTRDTYTNVMLLTLPWLLCPQVSTEHREGTADKGVTVEVGQPGGATYSVSGQTAGTVPTLTQLNGATFSCGAALQGDAIVYRSKQGSHALAGVTG